MQLYCVYSNVSSLNVLGDFLDNLGLVAQPSL